MKLEWKNKTAKTLTLAHFICFLENNCVGKFLLKPEILCLLFKQCCQIQNFVKSPKIALSDKILQKQNFGSCLKSKQRTSRLNRNLSKKLFFREQMKWDFVKALTPLVGLNRQIRRSWERGKTLRNWKKEKELYCVQSKFRPRPQTNFLSTGCLSDKN